jgi:hypothetical protein
MHFSFPCGSQAEEEMESGLAVRTKKNFFKKPTGLPVNQTLS